MDLLMTTNRDFSIRKLFQLLHVNLEKVFNGLHLLNESVNEQEEEHFIIKQDNNKSCIFDTVEIKRLRQKRFQLIFAKHSSKMDIVSLKRLVNNLHQVYGEDEYGKSRFSLNDFFDFANGYQIQRDWFSEEFESPTRLTYSKAEGFHLLIDFKRENFNYDKTATEKQA